MGHVPVDRSHMGVQAPDWDDGKYSDMHIEVSSNQGSTSNQRSANSLSSMETLSSMSGYSRAFSHDGSIRTASTDSQSDHSRDSLLDDFPDETERRRIPVAEAMARSDANFDEQHSTGGQYANGWMEQHPTGDQYTNMRMEQMQSMIQAQQQQSNAQLQAQQQQNNAMMQTMMRQMADLQNVVTKPDLLTTRGVESWVIEEEIHADFPEPARWRWPADSEGGGRLEDEWEQNTRSRIWVYLTSLLPRPMWSSLIKLDIRGIYVALRSVNRSNAISEATQLRTKLQQLSEKKKTMMAWLDDLWDCMEDLDKLRQPVSVEQVRHIVFAALKDDVRYADFRRDFTRNPNMDINSMKACLLNAARECDDLVGDPQPTLRLSKKAVDLTSSGNPVVDLPLQGGKGGKGGKGQHAHPQPKGTGTTSDAGGVVQTREDRGRYNKELCTNFLYGSCRRADACTRSHVSLAVVTAEAAKREKQRIETKASEGDGVTNYRGQDSARAGDLNLNSTITVVTNRIASGGRGHSFSSNHL